MKKFILPLIAVVAVLSGCTTYQYSARQVDVNRRAIDSKEQMAGVVVDYSRQVTATSDFQSSRKNAIAEAEFRCIEEEKIDVVVDPIYKIEYNAMKMKNRYKATIIGYAGKYESLPSKFEESTLFAREEIENYKLLYDPEFAKQFYNHPSSGDHYYLNSNVPAPMKSEPQSLMVKARPIQESKPLKQYDYHKAIHMRNQGIGLLVAGAVCVTGPGIGLLAGGHNYESDDYSQMYRVRNALQYTGIAVMAAGGAFGVIGIPLIAVGATRAKKAHQMDLTLNAGANGVGFGLTF